MTGSLVIARADSEWESAWDGRAGEGARENAERGTRKAEQARPALVRLFRVSTSAFRVSQDPIYEGPEEHNDAHNAVRGEEGRIEARQVSRLYELMFPRDQRCASGDADVVGDTHPRADPEQHERDQCQAVQQLGRQDGPRLSEPHHQ